MRPLKGNSAGFFCFFLLDWMVIYIYTDVQLIHTLEFECDNNPFLHAVHTTTRMSKHWVAINDMPDIRDEKKNPTLNMCSEFVLFLWNAGS